MYAIDKLLQPKTLSEALKLMQSEADAHVIAGGSDVLIKLRQKPSHGVTLISILGIEELRGVEMTPDGIIVIKPLTSFSDAESDGIINEHIPGFAGAVAQVAGPQVRNIGTIGGNICNGVTSADSAPMLFALNATVRLQSLHGTRTLPIEAFYLGAGRTDMRSGELLTGVLISKEDYEGMGGHYIKYAMRDAMDIATLGVACAARLEDGAIADVRLALGVAAPTPIRCHRAEQWALAKAPTHETLERFADLVTSEATPRTSWRATKEFRMHILRELVKRALTAALEVK